MLDEFCLNNFHVQNKSLSFQSRGEIIIYSYMTGIMIIIASSAISV